MTVPARPRNSKKSPAFGIPQKPAHLSEEAARQWNKLMQEIEASGLKITPAHRGLIVPAATLQADIKSDWAELQREGVYHNSMGRPRNSKTPPAFGTPQKPANCTC